MINVHNAILEAILCLYITGAKCAMQPGAKFIMKTLKQEDHPMFTRVIKITEGWYLLGI